MTLPMDRLWANDGRGPHPERAAAEAAQSKDEYRIVSATFRDLRELSFLVDKPRGEGRVAIPRSLIHAADDRRLHINFSGETITFRLRAWKAEELGLA